MIELDKNGFISTGGLLYDIFIDQTKEIELNAFEEYSERQLELCKRILGEAENAIQDACQEAINNVLKHSLLKNQPISLLWPYLRKATVNACYEELRRRHRERDRLDRVADRYFVAESRDPATAAMHADVLLTSDRIVREHFGPQDLEIFRLHYYDGLRLTEISSKLGLSYSTVKKHHRVIIAKVRQSLETRTGKRVLR